MQLAYKKVTLQKGSGKGGEPGVAWLLCRFNILVVGGGIAGCAIAYFLSRQGAEVTLVEQHDINSLASGSNAGSLHAQIPREPFLLEGEGWARRFAPVVPLLVESIALWKALSAELGVDASR